MASVDRDHALGQFLAGHAHTASSALLSLPHAPQHADLSVHLAAGDTQWGIAVQQLVEQLKSCQDHHRAAMYLLALQQPREAVAVYRNAGLWREALAVASAQLLPQGPLQQQLRRDYAAASASKGQHEVAAANALLAADPAAAAAALLARGSWASVAAALELLVRVQLTGAVGAAGVCWDAAGSSTSSSSSSSSQSHQLTHLLQSLAAACALADSAGKLQQATALCCGTCQRGSCSQQEQQGEAGVAGLAALALLELVRAVVPALWQYLREPSEGARMQSPVLVAATSIASSSSSSSSGVEHGDGSSGTTAAAANSSSTSSVAGEGLSSSSGSQLDSLRWQLVAENAQAHAAALEGDVAAAVREAVAALGHTPGAAWALQQPGVLTAAEELLQVASLGPAAAQVHPQAAQTQTQQQQQQQREAARHGQHKQLSLGSLCLQLACHLLLTLAGCLAASEAGVLPAGHPVAAAAGGGGGGGGGGGCVVPPVKGSSSACWQQLELLFQQARSSAAAAAASRQQQAGRRTRYTRDEAFAIRAGCSSWPLPGAAELPAELRQPTSRAVVGSAPAEGQQQQQHKQQQQRQKQQEARLCYSHDELMNMRAASSSSREQQQHISGVPEELIKVRQEAIS